MWNKLNKDVKLNKDDYFALVFLTVLFGIL